MRKATAVIALVLVVACVWAQPKMGRHEEGPLPASPLVGWLEDRFDQIHIVAKVGAPGIVLAGMIGLYLFFRKPPEAKRHKIRWVHAIVAFVFGLIAATHAAGFGTHHVIAGEADELWRSGTWLAAALISLLITGALRFWSWHHHGWWRWSHRTFQVLFLVALCVHVIPKILHAHTY